MANEGESDPSRSVPYRPEVSPEWRDLAASNKFLAVREDLAVIVGDPKLGFTSKTLVERIEVLKAALSAAGHDQAAVAVATVGFAPDMERDLFKAGAHVVTVPVDFFSSEDQVQSFEDRLSEEPAAGAEWLMPPATFEVEDNRAAYGRRSPFLTAKEIRDWMHRVENDAISG